MPSLPDLEGWAIFAKVADCGSFSKAAEELGLAKTTVSKSITRLEERLRASLFHRTTRKLSLTETGRLSLERARRLLADGAAIEADVLDEAAIPRGLIRAAVHTTFGELALAPILPEFLAAYPDIRLDLTLREHPVDLIAEGFDLSLQLGAGPNSALRVSRLFAARRAVVATPALIARHGMPQHPSELATMPALIPTQADATLDVLISDATGEAVQVHQSGPISANTLPVLLPSLYAGVGYIALPEFFVAADLASGRLIELLPGWSLSYGGIFVVSPPGRARPARVRVFLEFLRQHLSGLSWAQRVFS